MPKVSVNILTHNRSELLARALRSVLAQNFFDYEIVLVNDGSTDATAEVLAKLKVEKPKDLKIITNREPQGITKSRQEALAGSQGEYIAILDDDDEWVNQDKLELQSKFLDGHQEVVLVGGAIAIDSDSLAGRRISKFRPQADQQIRRTMLFRNNFFTSTVMFRRTIANKAGGFLADGADLGEDYDLWLRMGQLGRMYNFPESFVNYRQPSYNKDRHSTFLAKQLRLITKYKRWYPYYFLAALLLQLRLGVVNL